MKLSDDIREFTRLSDVNLDDLKLLLAEYRKLLNTVREQIDPSGRDEAFAVYSQVYRLYEDSARIWEVHSKSSKYLASAKEQWRKEVQLRAVALGKNVDNTDIIKAIAAFEFVI